MRLTPGTNVNNIIYSSQVIGPNKLECFVPGMPFQSSILLTRKAGCLIRVENWKVLQLGMLLNNLQISDYTEIGHNTLAYF